MSLRSNQSNAINQSLPIDICYILQIIDNRSVKIPYLRKANLFFDVFSAPHEASSFPFYYHGINTSIVLGRRNSSLIAKGAKHQSYIFLKTISVCLVWTICFQCYPLSACRSSQALIAETSMNLPGCASTLLSPSGAAGLEVRLPNRPKPPQIASVTITAKNKPYSIGQL